MTTSTIELSMDQMNAVNGGFSPLACVLGTIFGAGKGALVGGIVGGAVEGYALAFLDERGGKKN